VRLVEERPVTADGAGRLAVTVDGLAADTVYRYGWFAGAAPTFTGRSGLGRFRTPPPAGGKVTLRIAATTCTGSASAATRAELAPFAALSELAAAEPDLTLHLGDASYNDGAVTLDDYRAEWRRTLGEAGYRDLLASAGIYVTWDDHEIDDNYDPEAIDPARLAAGRQAFFEALPVERGDGDRLWTSYQWGDTVEVIVMDLRSERLPSTQGDGGGQFVSEAQLAFVEDRLANSTATFKLVLSSVNIANLSTPWDAPVGFDDRWEGWADQRTRLLDFIVDQDVRNVFFLAGDIHVGFVGRVEPEGHRHGALWELTVGPGASEANPLGLFYEFSDEAQRNDVFPCDQFVFAHGRQQVSTVLTLDPGAETLRAEYRDVATDELLFDGVLQHER
jgi:alkaline phosphatase D